MQAFLQRVLNAGGRIHREYGLGRKRNDLLVVWSYQGGVQEVVIELKIQYAERGTTICQGFRPTWGYMDMCGTDHGYLVIFDKQKEKSWEEKVFCRQKVYRGQTINVWGR